MKDSKESRIKNRYNWIYIDLRAQRITKADDSAQSFFGTKNSLRESILLIRYFSNSTKVFSSPLIIKKNVNINSYFLKS